MTEPDPPDGRPVDVAALADLDADLPDPHRAARGRAAAATDPDAAAVLDALAVTRAELAALPAPDVPRAVAARWTAALAAEAAPVDHHVAPRGASRRTAGVEAEARAGARAGARAVAR